MMTYPPERVRIPVADWMGLCSYKRWPIRWEKVTFFIRKDHLFFSILERIPGKSVPLAGLVVPFSLQFLCAPIMTTLWQPLTTSDRLHALCHSGMCQPDNLFYKKTIVDKKMGSGLRSLSPNMKLSWNTFIHSWLFIDALLTFIR